MFNIKRKHILKQIAEIKLQNEKQSRRVEIGWQNEKRKKKIRK